MAVRNYRGAPHAGYAVRVKNQMTRPETGHIMVPVVAQLRNCRGISEHSRMTEHAHCAGGSHSKNSRALAIAFALTFLMTFVEAAGGWISNSLALLGDAGHMLTDTLALGFSLIALHLSRRPATAKRTFGYHRTEIMAALVNGFTLLVVAGFIFYEAFERFNSPLPVKSTMMLVVAVVGLVVNIVALIALKDAHHGNLNVRSAFLHVAGDLLSSIGVIVAAVIIAFTGWKVIDPLIAVMIGGVILRGALGLLFESGHILLESVPRHIDLDNLTREICAVEGVRNIHDVHVWSITSEMHALSAHVLVEDQKVSQGGEILRRIGEVLRDRFDITHTTLQLECESCGQGQVCQWGTHADHGPLEPHQPPVAHP
jgi:cobalt-zinc-cadmium efflux system protein